MGRTSLFGLRLKHVFGPIVRLDEDLSQHTTMGVGGLAEAFIKPRSRSESAAVFRMLHREGIPHFVLGGGSNLVLGDQPYNGAVIHLGRLDQVRFKRSNRVILGAGVPLARAVKVAASAGLAGIEALIGIPGNVGGACYMNAGTPEVEFGDSVRRVWLTGSDGRIRVRSRDEMGFGYRTTGCRSELILAVELELDHAPAEEIKSRMNEHWKRKRETQPLGSRSAGCIFKNPKGTSAGRLIDESGLKGFRVGGATVSERHANFIVNEGGATAADIRKLIEEVRTTVREKRGVDLELEIRIPERFQL